MQSEAVFSISFIALGVLLGIGMGLFLTEFTADSLLHTTLDDVCVEIYGEGSVYEEQGINQDQFVCIKYEYQNGSNKDSSVRLELR